MTTIASNTPRTRLLRRAAFTGVAAMMMLGVAAGSASASVPPEAGTKTVTTTATKAATHKAATHKAATHKATSHKATPVKRVSHPSPTAKQLFPHGVPGGQTSFKPSTIQVKNAKAIVKAGQEMKLSARAQVIAVACSLQESKLLNLGNLGNRNDHDSLGLFQQRPSAGWGTPSQVTNPDYAAKSFYKALKHVSNYQNRPLTDAVQKVQVSAFPYAYAKWEKMAGNLVKAAYGGGPYASVAAH